MKRAEFYLESAYKPMGDQPTAIAELVDGVNAGKQSQVLLGVTGSGKTFTMANVIAELGRPALIMAPNKILAAQLYTEMKSFFPRNHVEYFVSYYDYYQPEAYMPTTDNTMIIISPRLICPQLIRILIKMHQLTNNWIVCGTAQHVQC